MKIKLDENMPAGLVESLTDLGHDVDTIPQEGLASADDRQVWQAAQQAERFFITQDLDFSDARRFAPGTHDGLLLVRLRNPGRLALAQKVQWLFEQEDVESWHGCFVVATDYKVRVRRPTKRNTP
jgi:predicted nuclease of predicted toxin-antitoxin system